MSLSVLFVDDDRNLLDGIARMLVLERNDIDFALASSGEEALELLKERRFDVIVSDQKMSGMKGLTLLSIVRASYPDVKRVMLSAQVHENVYREAESVADKYIAKPCDFETIIKEIDSLFE